MIVMLEKRNDPLPLVRRLIPVVTMPPGHTPGIFLLDLLFPTSRHKKRDNFPSPELTKNKLLRFSGR